MPWTQLSLSTAADRAQRLAEALQAAGALAVSLADAADDPVLEPAPGETRVWTRTRLSALFAAGTDLDPLRRALAPHLEPAERASWSTRELADQDWERAWLAHFRPLRFGRRLWVCPSDRPPPEPAAVNVVLDPGLAFGTGTHPSTALCLEWLDGAELRGAHLIDYGCGSGILAVAAALLGARSVVAVDIDPQALAATAENAARNGVGARISACAPKALGPEPGADIVLANILAGTLLELRAALCALLRPGGALVLSGILAAQAAELRAAYAGEISFAPERERDGWALLCGHKA